MNEIQERLKQARQNAGLSQKQTAKLIGTSYNAVSRWENGECLPQVTTMQTLAEVYGVSVGWLIEGEFNARDNEVRKLASKLSGLALVSDDLRKIADLLDTLKTNEG